LSENRRPDTLRRVTQRAGAAPALRRPSACVVNFDGREYLERSLGALRAVRDEVEEVLLVDNGSRDGSVDFVRERFPEARIVALGENRGPGAARNAGFELSRSDLVLFLDNDVFLTPGCCSTLVRALDTRADAAIVTPRVVRDADRTTIQFDGASSHFLGLMALDHPDELLDDALGGVWEISSLVSACMLVDRERWGGDALFDESFFIYLEDHDLGIRTRLRGHRILAVADAVCHHGPGTAGLSLRRTGTRHPTRVFLTIKNRWQILLKNYQVRTLLLLAPVLAFYETFQLAGAVRKGWLRPWLRAVGWIARHRRELAASRREVQRTRRVPDRDLLGGGALPFAPQLTTGAIDRLALRLLDAVCLGYWRIIRRVL